MVEIVKMQINQLLLAIDTRQAEFRCCSATFTARHSCSNQKGNEFTVRSPASCSDASPSMSVLTGGVQFKNMHIVPVCNLNFGV